MDSNSNIEPNNTTKNHDQEILKNIKEILQANCLNIASSCVKDCWDDSEIIVHEAVKKMKEFIENLKWTTSTLKTVNIDVNKIFATGEYKLDLKANNLVIYIYYNASDPESINFTCTKTNI